MSRRRTIWLIVLGVVAVIGTGLWYMQTHPGPADRLADYDPALTATARSGLPIIEALDKYRTAEGRYPILKDTATINPLVPLLPGAITLKLAGDTLVFDRPPAVQKWIFAPAAGDGYRLSIKLGWEATLVYRRDGANGQWLVSPGDGSAERVVLLKP